MLKDFQKVYFNWKRICEKYFLNYVRFVKRFLENIFKNCGFNCLFLFELKKISQATWFLEKEFFTVKILFLKITWLKDKNRVEDFKKILFILCFLFPLKLSCSILFKGKSLWSCECGCVIEKIRFSVLKNIESFQREKT